MKITCVKNYLINSQHKISQVHKNCSFKAVFGDDYNYDPGSIFALLDRKEREYIINPDDFDSKRTIGCYATDEPFKSMKINSLRYIGNNSYKGGMTDTVNYVKELKENGIQRVIVLCNLSECGIVNACKEHNMNWTNLYVPLNIKTEKNQKGFDMDFSISRFIDIVNSLREGNVFIGCESGNLRTVRFLNVIGILDPIHKLSLGIHKSEREDYIMAKLIYNSLSTADKKALNYTEEFEKSLVKTLKHYVIKL